MSGHEEWRRLGDDDLWELWDTEADVVTGRVVKEHGIYNGQGYGPAGYVHEEAFATLEAAQDYVKRMARGAAREEYR